MLEAIVDAYLHGIERIVAREEDVTVIICVVPDIVYLNCRPKSRVTEGTGFSLASKGEANPGQRPKGYIPFLRSNSLPVLGRLSTTDQGTRYGLRKTYSDCSGVHSAPARYRYLSVNVDLTPLSDRAWNLGLAVYYKSGGKPWRLAVGPRGVCYIGMAYRRAENRKRHADGMLCCTDVP